MSITPKLPEASPCKGQRPMGPQESSKLTEKTWTLDDLGEVNTAVILYAGCLDGDSLPLFLFEREEKQFLLNTEAEQLVGYALGETAVVAGTEYTRDVSRAEEDAIIRIQQEMTGKGARIMQAVKEHGENARHEGFTIYANGVPITGDSVLNSLITPCIYVVRKNDDGKYVKDLQGQPKPEVMTQTAAASHGIFIDIKDGKVNANWDKQDETVEVILDAGQNPAVFAGISMSVAAHINPGTIDYKPETIDDYIHNQK